jgi:hypothetical protein
VSGSRTWITQVALFLAGAVGGTLGDQIHVQFRVLRYPSPWLLGQAAWVPPLFGAAALLLIDGQRWFVPRSSAEPRPAAAVARTVALFYLAYLSTGLLQDSPRLLSLLLAGWWAARVALSPSADRVLSSLASALGGCLFEGWLSSTGAFAYRAPDVIGVPMWLGPLYLHVALMTRTIYLAVVRR